jgi:hypothetical protein
VNIVRFEVMPEVYGLGVMLGWSDTFRGLALMVGPAGITIGWHKEKR